MEPTTRLITEEDNRKMESESQVRKISTLNMSFVLFITLILDLLGFTVILPIMPRLLEYYGKDGSDGLYRSLDSSVGGFRELVGAPDTPRWNSVLLGGVLGSMFSLLQFLAAPFIGAASDVYGRKPMLILSMCGVACSYFIWMNATTFTWFVISRLIGGLSKGNISLTTAVVADVYPVSERGKGMAVIGISFSLGFLLGPVIGVGFISYDAGWLLGHQEFFVGPAMFALAVAILDIIYILIAFPETLAPQSRAGSITEANTNPFNMINPISLFRFDVVQGVPPQEKQQMRKIGVIYFLYLFIFSGLEYTLTFLTFLRFNYNSMQQGKMFFIMGLIMILVQGGYTRRKATGTELRTAISGVIILIPSFISIGYAYSAIPLYIGIMLFSFAAGTVVPSMTTMISLYGGDSQKGVVMGVFRALGALARALGPLAASSAFWSLEAETTYLLGAVLLIIPLTGLILFKYEPRKHSE